jgi:hypothetical protein
MAGNCSAKPAGRTRASALSWQPKRLPYNSGPLLNPAAKSPGCFQLLVEKQSALPFTCSLPAVRRYLRSC